MMYCLTSSVWYYYELIWNLITFGNILIYEEYNCVIWVEWTEKVVYKIYSSANIVQLVFILYISNKKTGITQTLIQAFYPSNIFVLNTVKLVFKGNMALKVMVKMKFTLNVIIILWINIIFLLHVFFAHEPSEFTPN